MVLACSSGTLTNVLPHRNAMPQTHDTSPRHSIQTQGRPVVVLSIDVERHSGIHYYRPDLKEILPSASTHTSERCYGGSQSVVWYKVHHTCRFLNPGPMMCESITLYVHTRLLLLCFQTN